MPTKRLFIFDMDGTLLPATTAALEISKITGHVQELEQLEKDFHDQKINTATFASAIGDLWADLEAGTIRKAFDDCPKLINIREALEAISSRGGVSCLITMSGDFFANMFYDYGFDHIFASKLNIPKASVTSPYVLHPYDKPKIAQQLCQDINCDLSTTAAFGDSMSDLPLFRLLTHTVAINGKENIKSAAKHIYDGEDLMEALSLVL